MKTYGQSTISEFLEDFVIFRNLIPLDERLPALDDIRERAGVPAGVTPRKSQAAYARVIVEILKAAKVLDGTDTSIKRLLYIGDTRLNDGTAFINIARAGNWPGIAFIASETPPLSPPEIVEKEGGTLYLAQRWGAITDFEAYCQEQNFPIDEQTAIIVDIDKTALGARGRNDHVINQARVAAVRSTVEDLLGDDFSAANFQAAYDVLNQTEFHPFMTDNQDYLAYICLILGSGLYKLEALVKRVRSEEMTSFKQFITEVNEEIDKLPRSLGEIHKSVYTRVQEGDPTPFKAFRYNEYRATLARMGHLEPNAPVDTLLANEIVITQEVRAAALRWKKQGALLFGLSDKPDEASVPRTEVSVPRNEEAKQGMLPIHRVETHIVGE